MSELIGYSELKDVKAVGGFTESLYWPFWGLSEGHNLQ